MFARKIMLSAAVLGLAAMSAPASANWGNWGSGGTPNHHPGSGHTSSTSGGWPGPGGSSTSTSSGGSTTSTSSGGTAVPEPGMLGLFGAGLIGIGLARARRRRN